MLQNMTEGAPLKLIIPFMVPLLIGNVFQQLYILPILLLSGGRLALMLWLPWARYHRCLCSRWC